MSPKYKHIQEEELKNKVAHDWFSIYDTTQIIGKIDFCIAMPRDEADLFEPESLLWAEAKAGVKKRYLRIICTTHTYYRKGTYTR